MPPRKISEGAKGQVPTKRKRADSSNSSDSSESTKRTKKGLRGPGGTKQVAKLAPTASQSAEEKTGEAPASVPTSASAYKDAHDFVANFRLPPKRPLKTYPFVQWDLATNKGAGMVRIGYTDNNEPVGTYIKQVPVPLRQDRLIQSKQHDDLDIRETHSNAIPSTSLEPAVPNMISSEISSLLSRVIEGLDQIKISSSGYTEEDFVKDTNKRRGQSNDPKNQQTKTCLNDKARPFSSITEIFDDIARKAESMGFLEACKPFKQQGLQVITMCSGTESPLIALDMMKRAFKDKSHLLNVRHVASAEIEPFKQAYIQRNFNPDILFRDVTEFNDDLAKPHTAFGGTAEQPDCVHMLVAGSSCIDYSSLNVKKKDFGEKGQSFSTLMGIANYCFRKKPVLVILENVDDAPWSQMIDTYDDIGYTAVCFKVDTKDFYLPQTRTRGYIVAFHTEKVKSKGFDLKTMFETVASSLQTFKQRASVPYSSFIYKDDDPELSVARKTFVTAAKENRGTQRRWTACRHRYAAYRAEHQIGFGRPYTQWRADGSSLPLDLSWVDWVKVQRERIWDTIDINYLLYLRQREFDMVYKSRWIELSQNVDRDVDQRHWGITNCLTPSGMPMDSRRGGPISGRESLALQGIPTDKLKLNKETSAQLQDLAGNAMSTTVVGSVIFSAIIASMKRTARDGAATPTTDDSIFEMFDKVKEIVPKPTLDLCTFDQLQSQAGCWDLKIFDAATKPFEAPMISEVGRRAAMAMQLCRCEGALLKTTSKISVCRQCGHTCCSGCRGNPSHDYGENSNLSQSLLQSRTDAGGFHEFVRRSFPIAIDVVQMRKRENLFAGHIQKLHEQIRTGDLTNSRFSSLEDSQAYLSAVSQATQETLTFRGIKRDKIIRVIYESPTARLEFQVQFDLTEWLPGHQEWTSALVDCAWLLFAKAPADMGAGSPVREMLDKPIFKMIPGSYLLDHGLGYNSLEKKTLTLKILPSGGPRTLAWESRLGIRHMDYQNIRRWPELEVEAIDFDDDSSKVAETINGVYKSLPDCGGASGTLHIKVHSDKNQRGPANTPQLSGLFLFLDPAPFRNASLDSMVFANIHERFPIGVPRRAKAVIDAPWRPLQLEEATNVQGRTEDIWNISGLKLKASEKLKNVRLLRSSDPTVVINSRICESYSSILVCRLPRFQHDSSSIPTNQTITVELIDEPEALNDLQWLIKSVCNSDLLER